MKRKLPIVLLLLALAGAFAFFFVLPGVAERRFNGRREAPPYAASERARQLHRGAALLQSKEERSRPGRASDLSRDSGKRAVCRALPGEAVIEHEHLNGSAPPFPNQPGSRFQFDTRPAPDLSGFVELLCELAELTLTLWAEPAKSDFLHPVGDSALQQLVAEMRRCVRLVQSTPVLAKLAETELRETRERLPASRNIATRAAHACSAAVMR